MKTLALFVLSALCIGCKEQPQAMAKHALRVKPEWSVTIEQPGLETIRFRTDQGWTFGINANSFDCSYATAAGIAIKRPDGIEYVILDGRITFTPINNDSNE